MKAKKLTNEEIGRYLVEIGATFVPFGVTDAVYEDDTLSRKLRYADTDEYKNSIGVKALKELDDPEINEFLEALAELEAWEFYDFEWVDCGHLRDLDIFAPVEAQFLALSEKY